MKATDAIVILKSMPAAYRDRVEEMIRQAMNQGILEYAHGQSGETQAWRSIAQGEYRK